MSNKTASTSTDSGSSQTPPVTDQQDTDDATLRQVMKGFRLSRKYTESGFWDTWRDSWKLYNNQRVSVGYDGFADTFIPETYTEIQGIKAHIVNDNLAVNFMPTNPDQKADSTVLQDLFNYAWYKDMMGMKFDTTITEYLVTGNCYIWSAVGEDGLPVQRVVSARDCFFDPNITNYQDLCDCGYGGYRFLTTLEDLKAARVIDGSAVPDDDSDEGVKTVPRYKDLDKVGQFSSDDGDKTAKQQREEMLGDSVLEDLEDMVECILYFGKIDGKNKMVTVANRSVVIEEVDTPFQRASKTVQSVDDQGNAVSFEMPEIEAFVPVAPFRNLVDPNLWYARGDVEVIGPSQERLNDVRAQKNDNLTYQLNRMWALDPAYAQKLDEIQSVPGAVFTLPPGALEQITTQPIGPEADNEVALIKAEMQGATAFNELVGTTMQHVGRTSMYQINAELMMLGSRFKVKIKQLEEEGMRILALNMWKIMQIYIDKEIPVRVAQSDGSVQWKPYNPGLYLGDWDVQVKLGADVESMKETQRQQAMQFFLLASKMPFVDPEGLFVRTATQVFDLNARDARELIVPVPPPKEPTVVPKLMETIQFTDLYPDEQAELLAESGIKPSPYREEVTGINASQVNPEKVATNAAVLHGKGTGGKQTDFHQAGMQTAGSAPVGVPNSGVANIPRVPS